MTMLEDMTTQKSPAASRAAAWPSLSRPTLQAAALPVYSLPIGHTAYRRRGCRTSTCFTGSIMRLHGISLQIPEKQVTAFIGPSGCGWKSTLAACSINRMNDLVDNCRIEGSIRIHGREIYASRIDVISLRTAIGMVFPEAQISLPKTMIYENVIYSLRIDGIRKPGSRCWKKQLNAR